MGPCRTAVLLMLATSQAYAQTAAPVAPPLSREPSSQPVERILLPPPLEWDNEMLNSRPALQQTAADFANLTGGLAFGMSPTQVNAVLPDPYPGLSWDELSMANEYPGEVRYFGVAIDRAGVLRMGVTSCSGAASYMVMLFTSKGLFRLSYRLIADKGCPDTNAAAQEIFARYVPIGQDVAMSMRYRTGATWVVDVTDPTAGYLISTRWGQGYN